MSELEPTRTCSNPTATEVLRRMLDEHDEYYKTSGNKTWWGRPIDRQTGKPINVFHYQAQPMGEDRLLIELQLATPEQAIAATLGATDANPTQEESSGTCNSSSCSCLNNCTNGERTETCEADETDTWECVRDDLGGYGKTLTVHVMECTECGHTYEHVNGDYEYCPRCGRKRKDVDK